MPFTSNRAILTPKDHNAFAWLTGAGFTFTPTAEGKQIL
jgi:hypothetical protein